MATAYLVKHSRKICARCGRRIGALGTPKRCYGFDPFTRLADAMLLATMMSEKRVVTIKLYYGPGAPVPRVGGTSCSITDPRHPGNTEVAGGDPVYSIAEACYREIQFGVRRD